MKIKQPSIKKKNQGKEIILKPMLINTKEYNNTVKKDDS